MATLIQTQVKGIEAARQVMRQTSDILAGRRGSLWADETRAIQRAIEANADKSYTNSPAKEAAIKSAEEWKHFTRIHRNRIMSTDYANIRQYCEDPKRNAVLVEFTEQDIAEQIDIFATALSRL